MELTWTEDLSLGNAIIDSDHKKLIDMTNSIKHEIEMENGSALSQAFECLGNWLSAHFANEEKIARAAHFPLDKHRQAHQYSVKELQYLKDELISKEGMWSESAAEHFCLSIENWAIEHITKIDMQMKPMLQSHPYDFQPD